MIGLSSEIPLVSHTDVTSPFPPSGNEGYMRNRDVCCTYSEIIFNLRSADLKATVCSFLYFCNFGAQNICRNYSGELMHLSLPRKKKS